MGPRFLTSLVYHRFYLNQLSRVSQLKKKSYLCHVWLALSLNLVEQAALIGVTYVSNRENYRESPYFILKIITIFDYSITLFYSYSRKNLHRFYG